MATACSKPPPGRARWTLELLADEMVRLSRFTNGAVQSMPWKRLLGLMKLTCRNHFALDQQLLKRLPRFSERLVRLCR